MIPEALLQKAAKKGLDTDYLAWLRTMPSAILGLYGAWQDGEGRNEPAHVRRVSHGSGIAEKPPYSAIPLTHDEHAMQHQKGEEIFAPREWYEEQACRYLAMWINNVKPPVSQEEEKERTFIIHHAGGFVALWLWAKKYFQGANKPLTVIVRSEEKKRSLAQNAGLWAAIYGDLTKYYTENPTDFGMDMAQAILKQGINNDSVHMVHKLLHGVKSTARLNKSSCAQYFETVAAYMMEHHKYEVKMPINNRGSYEFQ